MWFWALPLCYNGFMKKVKKLIIGNWKMNPASTLEAKKIATDVKRGTHTMRKTQVVLCPPYIYIPSLINFPTTSLFLGAQNAHHEAGGSFTGEVSFSQLPQFKVSHVILGHSERRAKGETTEMINKKLRSVVVDGMTAVLCVGESVRDNHGDYLSFVREQIVLGLRDVSRKSVDHIVVAYEPVWAIGARDAMSPQDIHEMSIFIRKTLREVFGPIADGIRILYGGAVNESNAKEIVQDGFVQGLLIGRESLKPKNFIEIIKAVDPL